MRKLSPPFLKPLNFMNVSAALNNYCVCTTNAHYLLWWELEDFFDDLTGTIQEKL